MKNAYGKPIKNNQAPIKRAEQTIANGMQQLETMQSQYPSFHAAWKARKSGDLKAYLREAAKYAAAMERLAAQGTALENKIAEAQAAIDNQLHAYVKRHTGKRR